MLRTISTTVPDPIEGYQGWAVSSGEPPADWGAALAAFQQVTPGAQLYGNDKTVG